MKEITDIEKLSPEELERIASDSSVKVPADLHASLEALAGAAELTGRSVPHRPVFWAAISAAAAAVVAGVILFTAEPKSPVDTFSDPYLAYAEVQKAFDHISRTGEEASRIAGNAVPVIEKTEDILNRIMK